MRVYDVVVPFEPLLYEEDPSYSRTTRLPDNFDLPAMSVAVDAEGTYKAKLHMEASSGTLAKEIAVARVEEFLALQAAWNDGFRVRLRGARATQLHDESAASVEREKEGVIRVTVTESVETESSLDAVVLRNSVGFVEAALEKREQWPEKLKTVLKLNYLAVASHDAEPALVVQYSALEVLTTAILGEAKPVLGTEIDLKDDRRKIVDELKEFFLERKLSPEGAERLSSYASNAKMESNIDRIIRALDRCGVKAGKEEVRFVVQQRGKIAHAGTLGDEDLHKAYELARSWTQTAVRYVVEAQGCNFP